ncbi:family 18 putative glycoside hydrolase [Triangularia verruculosa]|uniref:chitinase n=1 Tax=Triangularia verruculosa TaxID=2587418 RepID=A0AAN7AQY6_9PEZI|nr:family 18 putative glycoside hydrolase [Triangularia verruculosa]
MLTTAAILIPFLLGGLQAARAAPKQIVQLAPQEGLEIVCNAGVQQAVTVTVTQTVMVARPSGSVTVIPAVASSSSVLRGQSLSSARVAGASSSSRTPSVSSAGVVASPASSAAVVGGGGGGGGNGTSGFRNALYFTNWGIYGANFQPQDLPADQITHVLYSFADIASNGEVISSDSYSDLEKRYPTDSWNDQGNNAYGCVKQMYLLKKKHRQLKVLLSIGGWTYSPKFAPVAATAAGRKKFCSSAVKLVQDWGFDGLDIDWEYPASATEAADFVALLKECRETLDEYSGKHAKGYHMPITIACPAGPTHYNQMDIPRMDKYIDAWHLMAYDYAGSWDSTSGHQSNIFLNTANPASTKFSTEKAINDYVAKGVAPNKIVLGLPLYGRAFQATSGPGKPYSGIGEGSAQAGIWLYKDLPRLGAKELWDEQAMASYSFDEQRQELISYDTVRSAVAKVKYLKSKGLGGTVFWEAAGDKKEEEKSLVKTVVREFGGNGKLEGQLNLLSFPVSEYDNIRAGMP